MNEITIDENALRHYTGLNKYALLQSQSPEVRIQYNEVFEQVEGSLTTVTNNDGISKFKVAITTLNPTLEQEQSLKKFETAFKSTENQIDPEKLQFKIEKAADNEVCVYKKSDNGICNIIINDDATIAFSFIAFKNSNKPDIYTFYDQDDQFDYEYLGLKFFSL